LLPHMDGSIVFARLCQCAPSYNTCILGPSESILQDGISIGSAVPAQLMAESPYIIQWASPSPSILALYTGKLDCHLTHQGFRAQRFYLNLLLVLVFLHHSTDLDEPDKPVTSVFLISQHRKSYKPSKNGAICAWAYLLCAQRF